MDHFKNLMVGLTLNGQDKAKIRYAGLVSWLASSERITFSHIIGRGKIPEHSEASARSSVEDETKDLMKELVEKYYDGDPATRIEYDVILESPLVEIDILRALKEHKADLIILGKISGEFTGEETVPVKISRKAAGSTLYVPEEVEPRTTHPEEINILIPVDFSENAADAMILAVDFAVTHEIPSIYSLHVYDVPLGYYKRGKEYEEFAEVMEKNAEKKYQEFINEIDLKGVYVKPIILRLKKRVHQTIAKTVEEYGIDLIIIGSRGKKAAARLLLDSVTEQLIRTTTVPLLSFKKKDKDMSLLEALLRL
ncbi:MAG: universal stress protein [Syntrophobacterales bacterium]|nr:MAG: universal stress protein [Syntrophobacterales bacterium]